MMTFLSKELGYYSLEEVGTALGIPADSLKKHCKKHQIPISKVGHSAFIDTRDLYDLMERSKVTYGRSE